jgi:hypothetical protein
MLFLLKAGTSLLSGQTRESHEQRAYDTSRVMSLETACFSSRRAIRDSEIKQEKETKENSLHVVFFFHHLS